MTDEQHILQTRNTARFFVETRHISWVLLVATIGWGVYGYLRMPQRKDPDIPVRVAVALTPWPGAAAEKGEQLDDIKLKLDSIGDLPEGAGPINFIKDFGDTAALMLTLASPKAADVEIDIRSQAVRDAIERVRSSAPSGL